MSFVTVREILHNKEIDLGLQLVDSEKGLDNKIKIPFVQKAGLAMAGYVSFVVQNRVQVFGKTEISYLTSLPKEEQEKVCRQYFDQNVSCCIITRGMEVPPIFLAHAERANTPVMTTELKTHPLIERLTKLLEKRFAKSTSIHGVLIDVFGIGFLLLGDSGIGKSECALDLIIRGHRLVADDIVELARQSPIAIYGQGPEITKYHMEIRGLGIINIKELFGVSAIRDQKKVHVVVKLVNWEDNVEYDRIGLDERTYTILAVDLPLILLPVRPGRNLSTIIEVAARNYLLKLEGFHAAQEFQKKLLAKLSDDGLLATEEAE